MIVSFWQNAFSPKRVYQLLLCLFTVMALLGLSIRSSGQSDARKNKKPKITGQKSLSVKAGESITISLTDLYVDDPDDFLYPFGFTLKVNNGPHYTLDNKTVTPEKSFTGVLHVSVRVNDGDNDSDPYDLLITVVSQNVAPVITGQEAITTTEDNPVTILVSQLQISDADDSQFTLTLYAGEHYTLNNTTVIPETNYNGNLTVPATVNDGEASSNTYNLTITVNSVNDVPKIIGQNAIATEPEKPVTITLTDLQVEDPDDTFPTDFTFAISTGINYSLSDKTVTPSSGFTGTLSVPVKVSDGQANSDTYSLAIQVKIGNTAPVIVNQSPVIIKEDESFEITFAQLEVADSDDSYPRGFSMNLSAGKNYTVNNQVVIPAKNFSGNITVPVSVSDGAKSSEPFNFQITITPVNDPPELATSDNDTLFITSENEARTILTDITASDVDNETLVLAEVWIDSTHYDPTTDKLIFSNTANIKGVFDVKSGVLALIGKATISEYADALKTIKLQLAGGSAFNKKTIYARVNDGISNSNRIRKSVRFGKENLAFDIPTGFTPNGDFVNDTWSIITTGDDSTRAGKLSIFTKTGLLVFETDDLSISWDGRYNGVPLPADVYFYTVKLANTANTSQATTFNGIVTILR